MSQGELFIWTDVEPTYEAEFNKWYDDEHMEERAAIPGFNWSRRYRSTHGSRPYLALYRTQSLDTFTSTEYQKIFENQTAWSLKSYERRCNTTRRVMAVHPLYGTGTGSALGLLTLPDQQSADKAVELAVTVGSQPGVISLRMLTPDPKLSTPLPSENAKTRTLNSVLVLECTTQASATQAVRELAYQLNLPLEHTQVFELLWELRSADLT